MLWLLSLRSALGAALTFISKPPGIYIAAAIAACLGLWWVHHDGFRDGVKWQLAQNAEAAANINAGQPKIIERIRTVYLPQEIKIRTITKTIAKEVPVYVTQRDDASCVINNGFKRLHDSAAKGELPGSPAGDDGNPSGVKLSEVAQTVTGNYGTCHLAITRVNEWQEWYRQNRALWNSNK